MSPLKWVLAGGMAATLGAAAWEAVASSVGSGAGWVACGVGLLAGLGVRLVASEGDSETGRGLTAVTIALIVTLISKYNVVHETVPLRQATITRFVTMPAHGRHESVIASIAKEIAAEQASQGSSVEWPEDSTIENAEAEEDFPPILWTEAINRWNSSSEKERDDRMAVHEQARQDELDTRLKQAQFSQYLNSFHLVDLLWFGFAAAIAYWVASGRADG